MPRWHAQIKVVVNPSTARALLESDRAALSSAQWTLQIAPTPNTKKKVTENSPRNGIGLHRSNFALFDTIGHNLGVSLQQCGNEADCW